MDPALVTLATTAGTTLVQALTTDGWEKAKHAIVGLWQRNSPAGAEFISDGLDSAREQLSGAQPSNDDATLSELRDVWRGQLIMLLQNRPDAAGDLRDVMQADLAPLVAGPRSQRTRDITQTADVKGHGIAIQAGGDVNMR